MLEDIKIFGEYFDEDFFLVLEDFDLCWRAQKKGWKFLHIPELICFHSGGFSQRYTPLLQYLTLRNRYYLLLKNEDDFLRFICSFFLYDILHFIYFAGRNKYFHWLFRDLRRGWKKMLSKRRLQKL